MHRVLPSLSVSSASKQKKVLDECSEKDEGALAKLHQKLQRSNVGQQTASSMY